LDRELLYALREHYYYHILIWLSDNTPLHLKASLVSTTVVLDRPYTDSLNCQRHVCTSDHCFRCKRFPLFYLRESQTLTKIVKHPSYTAIIDRYSRLSSSEVTRCKAEMFAFMGRFRNSTKRTGTPNLKNEQVYGRLPPQKRTLTESQNHNRSRGEGIPS
jgi:hypothetical protein